MSAPERVLVKSTNWLGDVVMTVPALRAVRGAFPRARLSILVRRELASFFAGSRWVDEVLAHPVRPGSGRIAEALAIARELRARAFDLAVILPRSFEAAFWAAVGGIPARVGYASQGRSLLLTKRVAVDPAVESRHQVERHLHLVRAGLGIDGDAADHRPDVDGAARARIDEWLAGRRRRRGPLIALAPGAAYGPAKEWPAAHYATLVDRLAADHDAEAVLVGAPSERAKCVEVAERSASGALVAAGETTIAELIALLDAASGFAGNDSGAMHVAGALGRPSVGIFGSTSPERTGPLGSRARVLYDRIECSPCYDRRCRFGHTNCLVGIEPGRVAAALAELGAFPH